METFDFWNNLRSTFSTHYEHVNRSKYQSHDIHGKFGIVTSNHKNLTVFLGRYSNVCEVENAAKILLEHPGFILPV